MLVEVIKGGAKRDIHPKVAAILIKQGHVREVGQTYQTRDMRAVQPTNTATNPILSMTLEELRALAAQRGIKIHHRAGADKIREALSVK